MVKNTEKTIIGKLERISFPEFGLKDIPAKVDTGSYRGTLHCHSIRIGKEGDQEMLYFTPLDPSHQNYPHEEVSAKDFKQALIKSSSGHSEKRYVVNTPIIVRGKRYKIELSLSRRHTMRYPVLLGRKFLRGRFIVDLEA